MKRRRVTPNFGAEVDVGKGTVGGKLNVMIGEGPERGDEVRRVAVKLSVTGNGT